MRKVLLAACALMLNFAVTAQATSNDCFKKMEAAFEARGAYTVSDDMHRNVILSFFSTEGSTCVNGKVRVENGIITSILIQYEDDTYELFDVKFANAKKSGPIIVNGISEMIYSADGQKFKVVFIDKLKPKAKSFKKAAIPTDL